MIILTDLSEVLIRGVYGIEDQIKEQYGESVADHFVQRNLECNPLFVELMRGHLTEAQYWDYFFQDRDWPFGVKEITTICSFNFALGFQRSAIDVYKRIVEYPDTTLTSALRHRGRPEFWIVSDHIAERKDEIELMHPKIFQLVSKVIWSYDLGLVKHDTGFFQQLLRRHNLKYYEVLFIDDMAPNIWSAATANIAGIEYRDPEQLETQLRSYGFRFEPV